MGAVAVVSDFQSADEAALCRELAFTEGSPVQSGKLAELFRAYAQDLEVIKQVSAVMDSPAAKSVLEYYEHASYDDRDGKKYVAPNYFALAPVKAALDAQYWDRALKLTNVLELMPQARRSEWASVIRTMKAPEFTPEATLTTLAEFQSNTLKYFAERVEGVFNALSKSHITNKPQGFSERMIVAGVIDKFGYVVSEKGGYIHDLRCAIARVKRTDEPPYGMNQGLINGLKYHYGKWRQVDGGAMRFKFFRNGNLHIEVSPDIAWQLNAVLATLYPLAIPSQFRAKPKKPAKEFHLYSKPLDFSTRAILGEMRYGNQLGGKPFTSCRHVLTYDRGVTRGSQAEQLVEEAVKGVGGVPCRQNLFRWFEFDYDPRPVIGELMVSGCLPDHVSHQFYPTREKLARMAVDYADIRDGHDVCEPEAGLGGIAQYIPQDKLTCIEISALHCAVLEAMGFKTIRADYLKWADEQPGPMFDRIISNPPFSKGRAELHMKASAAMLRPGGRLVAILPASLHRKDILGPGWSVDWQGPFTGEFEHTGVSVSLMIADKFDE